MHIALDGRPLSVPLRGIGVYTQALVERLPHLAPHHRFSLLMDRPPLAPISSGWTIEIIPTRSRNWWEIIQLPAAIHRLRIDLYHGVDHFQIPWHPACPTLITVHDMASWLFPETVSWKFHWLFRVRLARAVKVADQIIAVSQSTANDLHRLLPRSINKTTVIHLGVNHPDQKSAICNRSTERSRHLSESRSLQSAILKTYGISKPFILSVCALEPRKNLDTLLTAFALLMKNQTFRKYSLILVGQPWRQAEKLYQLAESIPHVVFTGHLPPHALIELYQQASLFVYPSWYEGFGLPPLEALANGAPVLTSHTSSFPEVLEKAAAYVDTPRDPNAWHQAIAQLLSDPDQLSRLRRLGPPQSQKFSWDRMAQETLKIYEQASG